MLNRSLHERLLAEIAAERWLSRRRLVAGSATVAGGGAPVLTLAGAPRVELAQDAAYLQKND